jgi:hypothetical protein
MGLGVKWPMPIPRRHALRCCIGQKGPAWGCTIRQRVMGKPNGQTQAMPSKERDRARSEPPRRIGAEPEAAPARREGR